MKLNPKYSYEYNCILNESYTEDEQIKNFASTISDKDRFLVLLPLLEKNSKLIEEGLGVKLKEENDFYVTRAEKFKSFSEPITIEYSICPEEMLLYLLKEILRTANLHRFPDEESREEHLNAFIDYVVINGDFNNIDLIKFTKNLHEESKLKNAKYEYKEIDFKEKTMNQYIEELYQ